MIPYIDIPTFDIYGDLKIQPFGLLVFLALLTGYNVALWYAGRMKQNKEQVGNMIVWTVVSGFIVAHLVSVIFYFPERILRDPLELIKIWTSISSYGGFLGGTIGAILYIRKEKLDFWPHIDTIAVALTVGWFFGRMGCTVAHDHPGKLSDIFFAVQFPGGARFDLGLYEWIFTIFLNIIVFTQVYKKVRPGIIVSTLMILYAPVRFALDFLRTADKHYLGLTPGQYFSIALLFGGILVAYQMFKRYKTA